MSRTALLHAVLTVLLNGSAQLLLRKAALAGATPARPRSLASGWFLGGIGSYAVSVLTWLTVLKSTPLAIATPFVATVYVAVPLASRRIFRDPISFRMWLGMLLVLVGVSLVAMGGPEG